MRKKCPKCGTPMSILGFSDGAIYWCMKAGCDQTRIDLSPEEFDQFCIQTKSW